MSSLLIVKPLAVLTPAVSSGGPAANLSSPDPKEAWLAGAAGGAAISWDTGAASTIDTVHVGFANLPHGATVSASVSANVNRSDAVVIGNCVIANAGGDPRPRHALMRGASKAGRYVDVTFSGMGAIVPLVGVVSAGKAMSPFYGNEQGSGRIYGDTGSADRLFGGGFGINEGTRWTGWGFTMGDLTEAELAELDAVVMDRGSSRSVLVVEDPDQTAGLNERIHWGIFDRLEEWARIAPGATRWSFRVKDWA